jgi:3-oxoacyl-[acyl-carrier-protein] synthase I
MTRPVYIAGDNIISSLGFSTPEVIQCLESGIAGFQRTDDRSLSPVPLPLSMISRSRLEGKFRDILGLLHPGWKEEEFTRLEKMFILSILDAIKEIAQELSGSNTLLVISSTKGNIDLLEESRKSLFAPDRVFLWKMANVIAGFF